MLLSLHNEERILAKDSCLYHKSAIAYHGYIILTNLRLIFQPTRKIEKMMGAENIVIEIEFLSEVELTSLENFLNIQIGSDEYRFSGHGALRVHPKLLLLHRNFKGEDLNVKEIEMLNEVVVLQGPIDIFRFPLISTRGEFTLSETELRIRTNSALENLLLSSMNLEIQLNAIRSIKYDLIEKKLRIITKERTYTLGQGLISENIIAKLFLFLSAIRDGNFKIQRPLFEVNNYENLLSVEGYLLATSRRFLFCPTKPLDSITGSKPISIPYEKINSIFIKGSLEPRVHIRTHSKKSQDFIFTTPNPQGSINSLVGSLASFKHPPLFKDLRYVVQVNKRKVDELMGELGINTETEVPILVEWGVLLASENRLLLGWLFLTKKHVRFISLSQGEIFKKASKSIQLGKLKSKAPILQIYFDDESRTFIPQTGSEFSLAFWSCLKEGKPKKEDPTQRKGQSLRSILGMAYKVIIKRDDDIILEIEDVKVEKKVRGVRIYLKNKYGCKIDKGEILYFELPKKDGRFRFSARVNEAYIMETDPIGRYYLTVDIPKEITVHNERSAFRLPFVQDVIVKRYTLKPVVLWEDVQIIKDLYNPYLKENDRMLYPYPFTLPDLVTDDGEKELQMNDISNGGCALMYKGKILPRGADPNRSFLYLEIPLESRKVPVLLKVVNSRESKEHAKHVLYGCEFVNIPIEAQNRLKQGIVQIERACIKELMEMEERARMLGLL
jgi:hypothetical protein